MSWPAMFIFSTEKSSPTEQLLMQRFTIRPPIYGRDGQFPYFNVYDLSHMSLMFIICGCSFSAASFPCRSKLLCCYWPMKEVLAKGYSLDTFMLLKLKFRKYTPGLSKGGSKCPRRGRRKPYLRGAHPILCQNVPQEHHSYNLNVNNNVT